MSANYDNVNAVWPDNAPVPTAQEALSGARRLVRLACTLGPPNGPKYLWHHASRMEFKLTSGNRASYARRGVFYVNPNCRDMFGGWQSIVHDISHWAGRRLFPGAKPHDARTAFIERRLAEHVVKSGWLDGRLKQPDKPKPTKGDVQRQRFEATLASIERWERKAKRARTALRKLAIRKKYYERQLAA